MPDVENIIKGLEKMLEESKYNDSVQYNPWADTETLEAALALLKAQEPVKPMLARGWYWCGGIGCRNSLTSALENGIPARKPNYCECCGRAVKWE